MSGALRSNEKGNEFIKGEILLTGASGPRSLSAGGFFPGVIETATAESDADTVGFAPSTRQAKIWADFYWRFHAAIDRRASLVRHFRDLPFWN
jgi:hypothetical protein